MGKYPYKIDGTDLTAQEEYVLDQVQAGEIADLKARFGEAEENRRLRGRFLEELLSGGFAGFKVHRRGIRLAHGVVAENLDLENAEIDQIVRLFNCLFKERANFRDARFQRHLFLNECQFSKQGIFHRIKVEINLFCRNAVFQGRVDFVGADIGGQFNALGAQFQGKGKENEANFNHMKVGQSAFFRKAVFQEPVDFRGADIERQFNADGVQFQGQGPDNEVNFNAMKVGAEAFFIEAVLQGPVNFGGADIGGQFNAQRAQFQGQGPDNEVNFNAMKVGADAFFSEVVFQGPVDFVGADIGGQFDAREAKFENEDGTALFNGMKVGDIAFFDGAVFKGGLTFADARLLDLMLCDLQEPVAELSLERTVVGRELSIRNATFGKLKARNLEVKVNAALEQVTIQEEADWRDSSFQALHLHEVIWPANKNEVWLEGMAYKAIYASEWEKLLAWVEGSRFNTQNYSELEAYFARCGHRDRADKVFIRGQRRAWGQLRWWSPGKWGILLLWDWLAGYGRKPGRVLIVGLALFLLGAWIYDPGRIPTPNALNNLGLASDNWLQSLALRGIYSLYGLLSAIPGWSGHLELRPNDFFTLMFLWIQRLCGWILIPIGLAAVYTRLK
jgi:hypothetical protein